MLTRKEHRCLCCRHSGLLPGRLRLIVFHTNCTTCCGLTPEANKRKHDRNCMSQIKLLKNNHSFPRHHRPQRWRVCGWELPGSEQDGSSGLCIIWAQWSQRGHMHRLRGAEPQSSGPVVNCLGQTARPYGDKKCASFKRNAGLSLHGSLHVTKNEYLDF